MAEFRAEEPIKNGNENKYDHKPYNNGLRDIAQGNDQIIIHNIDRLIGFIPKNPQIYRIQRKLG